MRTDRQTAVVAGLATIGIAAVAIGSLIGPEWTPTRPESAGTLGDVVSLAGVSLLFGACFAYWATAPHRDFRGSRSRRRFARAAAMAPLDASGGSSASGGTGAAGAFSALDSSAALGARDGSRGPGGTKGSDSSSGPVQAVGELAVMPDPGRRSTPDRRTAPDRRSAKDRRATRRSTPDRRVYDVLYSDADPYPDPLPHGRVEPSAASTQAAATAVKQALDAAAAIAKAAGAPGTTPFGPQAKGEEAPSADAYSGAYSKAAADASSPLAGLEEYVRSADQAGQSPDHTGASAGEADPSTNEVSANGSGARRRSHEPTSRLRRARSLDRIARDARIGKAAENYVGAIVGRVGRASHDVKVGTVLGPPEISFHHGDIDFLLVGRDGAPSFLLEVKAANPERRGGAEGEKHAAQAARGRRAVLELTDGAVNPIPIVVYVDPIGTGADTLKLRPLESSETHAGVWSVGAKGLESAIRSLAQEYNRSRH